MISLFLLLITFSVLTPNSSFVSSFAYKSCVTCKWFVPNNIRSNEYALCEFFKEKVLFADQEKTMRNFAKHCRDDEKLCGKEGRMHEQSLEENIKKFEEKRENLIDKFNDSVNIGHGEVTEKTDLDELNNLDEEIEKFTKEGLELLFKVKKFNKRKILFALDKICPKDDYTVKRRRNKGNN
jgi:hypothetical protein